MNMGVDGKSWDSERLCHDDTGCLVPNAREFFEFSKTLRYVAAMFLDQDY